MNEEEKIGLTIKLILKRMGISQKKFAKTLGIPASSLSAYLNDKREMPARILIQASKELKLDLNALFHVPSDNVMTDPDEIEIVMAIRRLEKKDKAIVTRSVSNLLNRIK